MKPLIKMRLTEIKRKTFSFICCYSFIPAQMLFFLIMILFSAKKLYILRILGEGIEGEVYKFKDKMEENFFEGSIFYKEDYNSSEKEYIQRYNISRKLVINIESNNKEKGEQLKDYLINEEKFTNVSLNENITGKDFIIKLDYNEKEDGFDFSFKSTYSMQQVLKISFDPNDISNNFKSFYKDTLIQDSHFYFYDEFSQIQRIISQFLIFNKKKSKTINKDFNIFSVGTTIPSFFIYSYSIVDTLENMGRYFGAFLSFIFVLILYAFTTTMIEEKEEKLDKLLERNGITTLKYYISWFFTFILASSFAAIVEMLWIIALFRRHFILYTLVTFITLSAYFSFSFFLATIFSTNKSASVTVKLLVLVAFFIGIPVTLPTTGSTSKFLLCLLPHLNQMVNFSIWSMMQQFPFSFSLLNVTYNRFSYIDTILMYILQIVLYMSLSIFIKNFRSSGLGFIDFIKSLFIKVEREIKKGEENEKDDFVFDYQHEELSQKNKELQERREMLEIMGVTRQYGDLIAVNNWTGNLFPGEIFALLGHNGAGKTTLIKMISGTEDPDKGDIFLNGKSLVTNKDYLYKNLGLCQQEDILFNYLTVREHLEYMAEIKGSMDNEEEINNLINLLDLKGKQNSLCKTLSGGQKRKLSVALAMSGNSHIILLDEPTSGMDIIAKKELWHFLKNYKTNKIIILTTHSLDEAEYLGDRIGIMSEGRFLCSGTSYFLKQKYPCGYNINLLINNKIFTDQIKDSLLNQIREFDNSASIRIASKSLLSINMNPDNEKIKEIFNIIDNNKNNYGIYDFTVSSTTLEDVFLKLNTNNEVTQIKYSLKSDELLNDSIISRENYIKTTSFCFQLKQNLLKNLIPFYRDWSNSFIEFINALSYLYIFAIFFLDYFKVVQDRTLNNVQLFDINPIFIDSASKELIKNSYFYNKYSSSVSFKTVEFGNDGLTFANNAYEKATLGIVRSAISYRNNSNSVDFYSIYKPYTDSGYSVPNNMLGVSTYLKNEYGINAIIGSNIVNFDYYNYQQFDYQLIYIFFIGCIILLFSIVSFAGFMMNNTVRERIRSIKHLLYLSGGNMLSYWSSFYLFDYFKLVIFCSLLLPALLYLYEGFIYIYFYSFSFILALLPYIYIMTFISSKENKGTVILIMSYFATVFLLVFILIAFELYYIYIKKEEMPEISFTEGMDLIILDISPFTSFIFGYGRILAAHYLEKEIYLVNEKKLHSKEYYIFYSSIRMIIISCIYSLILYLCELNIMGKISNWLSLKIFDPENCVTNLGDAPFKLNENIIDNSIDNNNIVNRNIKNEYATINNSDLSIDSNSNENKNLNQSENPSIQGNITNDNQIPLIQYTANPNEIPENNSILISNNNYNQIPHLKIGKSPKDYIISEKQKVSSQLNLSLKINSLRKTFFFCCKKKHLRAVNDLYLGLESNEKFGLLGFNGSGKTTTFKCIINEILYDKGTISAFNKDTKNQFEDIRAIMGYCPQENPLFETMTVRETFKFYKSIKATGESIEEIAQRFGMDKYLDFLCKNLSGGNKRKLSCAVALMNRPRLLLLDEPSTGVDPESRRLLWKNINELSNTGHQYNMILTTHSMEEAEVLCDTVSWLKNGNFMCIGNPEKLKIDYSRGYQLHIKFRTDNIIVNNNTINNNINNASTPIQNNNNIDNNTNNYNNNINNVNYNTNINYNNINTYYNDNINNNNTFINSNQVQNLINPDPQILEYLNKTIQYFNYIFYSPNQLNEIYSLLPYLYEVIIELVSKEARIALRKLGEDTSFDFAIITKKERQSEILAWALTLRKTKTFINELSIKMENLEDILTDM